MKNWIPLTKEEKKKLDGAIGRFEEAVDEHLEKNKAQTRKEHPIFRGCLKYFPDALLEISNVSFVGNEQHNPGSELHWDRSKSKDEADAMVRHLLDAGKRDDDGLRHTAKMAWRALALLQREIENEK